MIAGKIAGAYAQYGLVPMIIPPAVIDPPVPVDRPPDADLQRLGLSAADGRALRLCDLYRRRAGALTNTLYWGPPMRPAPSQEALNA